MKKGVNGENEGGIRGEIQGEGGGKEKKRRRRGGCMTFLGLKEG